MEKKTINIHILDSKNADEQYCSEMGLFMVHSTDENIKRILNSAGIDSDRISNYMLFAFLWLINKTQDNYTDTIAFDGLDVWNMKLDITDDNTIVFVNENGDMVLNEDLYNRMSSIIRERLNVKD